jgi:ribonuclease HI
MRTIYFDGVCLANGSSDASAEAYVFDGIDLICYPVEGAQTNNRAELTALIKALEMCEPGDAICGDSEYAIRVTDGTYQGTANLDLVTKARELYQEKKPLLQYVPADENAADPSKGRLTRSRIKALDKQEASEVEHGNHGENDMDPMRALAKTSLRSSLKRGVVRDKAVEELVNLTFDEMLEQETPEPANLSMPVPFGKGRVKYVVASRSRPGLRHEVVVDARAKKALECSCEAGAFGNICWHMKLAEERLIPDMRRYALLFPKEMELEQAIEFFTNSGMS